ncbi:MAG: biotin--[acetyl-CoA-carboxylase] ligase [Oscillospiraceae bacterium]|jgi:BirA family biotin operon repressor/biotin-[acetyl-CoA-carboxylase] ligase|nr:biotin--[acetyl-CoA-carboxylase] ligase [Oscillospiraceae bacterium]
MREIDIIAEHAGLLPQEVMWHDAIASTSSRLYALAKEGTDLRLIAAERQTAGRGRGGKTFFSPVGGLYFSLFLACDLSDDTLALTPRVALGVSRVMARHGVSLGIKWVNDLFRDGKKVGGILTQVVDTKRYVVGVGMNLFPACAFPEELRGIAGYCADSPHELPAVQQLIGEIARAILEIVCESDNLALLDEYRNRLVVLGNHVTYTQDNRQLEARVIDITADGGLVVEDANGRCATLRSGEVHLRLA